MARVSRPKYEEIYHGASRLMAFDFTPAESGLGTLVSSIDWSIEEGSTITITDPFLANGITQAKITSLPDSEGCNLVRIEAIMENGEEVPAYLKVNVVKTRCLS